MDTTTPHGELLFSIFGALAPYERALTRERVTAGLAAPPQMGLAIVPPWRSFSQRVFARRLLRHFQEPTMRKLSALAFLALALALAGGAAALPVGRLQFLGLGRIENK